MKYFEFVSKFHDYNFSLSININTLLLIEEVSLEHSLRNYQLKKFETMIIWDVINLHIVKGNVKTTRM